jgi:hypothetical protein
VADRFYIRHKTNATDVRGPFTQKEFDQVADKADFEKVTIPGPSRAGYEDAPKAAPRAPARKAARKSPAKAPAKAPAAPPPPPADDAGAAKSDA